MLPVHALLSLQTMSLEEYEAQLAAKKAALNKPVTEVKVDMDAFKGMKTYVRKDSSEVVPGVELSRRKADDKASAERAAAEKARKQVCGRCKCWPTALELSRAADQSGDSGHAISLLPARHLLRRDRQWILPPSSAGDHSGDQLQGRIR